MVSKAGVGADLIEGGELPHSDAGAKRLESVGMRVLVIEDNPDIAENIADYLGDRGHHVELAADGLQGFQLAVTRDYDVIVLDLMLPGMDGLEVCRRLRQEARRPTPVLMATARDALQQKLSGFETGADDYMVKPFALQELEARLSVLIRRSKPPQARVLTVGELSFNLDTLVVQRAGKQVQLNPIALKLLQCLMEASPSVVTRQELEMRVWGEELPDSDSLRVHIHSLRAAIDKPWPTHYLQTRHGIGYRLVPPEATP